MASPAAHDDAFQRTPFAQQYKSQLRKTLLLKFRRPVRLCMELAVPLIMLLLVTAIKSTLSAEDEPARSYSSQAMRVPDVEELLGGTWYLLNLNGFFSHGASNMALSCDTDQLRAASGNFSGDFSSICEELKVAVIPESADDAGAVAAATAFRAFWETRNPLLTSQGRFDVVDGFVADSAQLESYVGSENYGDAAHPRLGAAVVFRSGSPNWEYVIRVNSSTGGGFNPNVPQGDQHTNSFTRGETDFGNQYLFSGFLSIQQDVDSFVLAQETGDPTATVRANMFAMPLAAFTEDPFWAQAGGVFAILLVLAMLYPVAGIVLDQVSAKETKTRELMFTMGLHPHADLLAWLTYYLCFVTVLAGLLTIVSQIGLFELADSSVVFVYFWLFLLSSVSFALFVSAVFQRTTLAIVTCLLLYFAGYFVFTAVEIDTPLSSQMAASLIPTTAFCLGTLPFAEYEGGRIPLTWAVLNDSSQRDFTMSTCLTMFFIDAVLYLVLALYLDAVLPTDTGAARVKWHYPLTALCRGARRRLLDEQRNYAEVVKEQVAAEEALAADPDNFFQPASEQLQELRRQGKCVMIAGLNKTFKTDKGPVKAVDDLRFTAYEGQILSLLGHNGAGKTTTVSMLTGLIPSSGGDAYVNGLPCSQEMARIRGGVGICPQVNILFDYLTVKEHLDIYADVKGVPPGQRKEAVREMIAEVGLTPKTDTQSKNLSGGMKRKLHLAIALLGNSKLVILDEPTSGLDPYSRTFTWKTIERHREGRTVLLVTHYLDEADLLGDRVAIMADGQLRCIGSSLFLKEKFGVGYQLTVETEGAISAAARKEIVGTVKSHVREAQVLSDVGTEVWLQLPLSASPKFQGMLAELQRSQARLGIVDLGISVTSLENVFLRVAEGVGNVFAQSGSVSRLGSDLVGKDDDDNDDDDDDHVPSGKPRMGEETDADAVALELAGAGAGAFRASNWTHVKAILNKRLRFALRDRRAWVCQLLLPIVFLMLGFVLLSLSDFGTPIEVVLSEESLEWNKSPALANPVPYNEGAGDSVSAAATAAWMAEMDLPRLDASQALAGVGATATYCVPNATLLEAAGFLGGVLGIDATPLLAFAPPVCPGGDGSSAYETSAAAFSDGLAATRGLSAGSRYGAVLFNVVPAAVPGGSAALSAAEFTIVYNFTGVHAAAVVMNRANAALLAAAAGSGVSLRASLLELPRTKIETDLIAGFSALPTALLLAIAFAFVPSYFAVFIVREKEQKSWHQQLINGVSPLAYWAANWIFDFGTYCIPAVVTLLFIFAFDVTVYKAGEGLGAVILLLILFGVAVTSFTYCCCFLFQSFKSSQFGMIVINLVGSLVLVQVSFVMFLISSTWEINDSLRWVYRLLPPYCFSSGLLAVANKDLYALLLNSADRGGDPQNPKSFGVWDLEIAGADILMLGIECIAYTALLLLLQTVFRNGVISRAELRSGCHCIRRGGAAGAGKLSAVTRPADDADEDEDVRAERARVEPVDLTTTATDDVVVLQHVRKVFPGFGGARGKVAVRDVSFGVPANTCFGLLGVNGAGKTTTLSMLTAALTPTTGEIFIAGTDVVRNPVEAQRTFGYCPQFDALFDLLTGREHLYFYGRVKGIPEDKLKRLVDSKLRELTLDKHADKLARGYSGGNKRKLSVAMATMGNPRAVFLDEPSSGMDPVSRRFMLDVINRMAKRASVILTTHSMTECEAVSSRIGIMVDGALRCLGSAQHLKSRFGAGFQLEVNLRVPSDTDVDAVLSGELRVGREAALRLADVTTAMHAAGEGELLAECFLPNGSAGVLHQQLTLGSGAVSGAALADWLVSEREFRDLCAALQAAFPRVTLLERVGLRLRFSLEARDGASLADVFGAVESVRSKAAFQGYSLGQTTLEQIFNGFAAKQEGMHPEH